MEPAKGAQFPRSITAVLLLLALLACGPQSVRIPTTPAGKATREFLAAYNSGDFQRVVAFFELHGSADRAIERAQWVMLPRSPEFN